MLLLEPNEIYFEDFQVNLIENSNVDERNLIDDQQCDGHLKICSKSLVFDPKNLEFPLIKIAYKNCNRIFIWPGKINNKESNVLAITCDQYTEMLSKNTVAPYTFKMENRTFLFNFHYARVYEYIDQLKQLHRASKLHACEQNDMVRVLSKLLCLRFHRYCIIFFSRLQQLCIHGINALNSIHYGLMIFMKQF